jgi:hypothetical protein
MNDGACDEIAVVIRDFLAGIEVRAPRGDEARDASSRE